jgi:quinolinate synthase
MSGRDLIEKINRLKKEKNAVILAHNFQKGEVQDIADYVGDKLELSQIAAESEASVVVSCGVNFMAEIAAILCPDKVVLQPDINAGCPMAVMVTADQLRQVKIEHPKAIVVSYIKSTADVKAESDYCCTAENAIKLITSSPNEIIFVPDKYLGDYVSIQTKKRLILCEGYCPPHVRILPSDILKLKEEHPRAEVLIHPQCRSDVTALADKVISSSEMCKHAKESSAEEFIIGTEIGILHRLNKENPDKRFYMASERAICKNHKLIDLEKIYWALEDMNYRIKVPEEIAVKVRRAIDRCGVR